MKMANIIENITTTTVLSTNSFCEGQVTFFISFLTPSKNSFILSIIDPQANQCLHGWRDSNPQPMVLETTTLPIELHPYAFTSVFKTLFNNFCYHTGTYGTATFTDSKAQAFLHGHRLDQFDCKVYIIARHDHLYSVG